MSCRLLLLGVLSIILFTPLAKSLSAQNQVSSNQIIDGAHNPELIADWRAYSLLFRLVSHRSGAELHAIRAYLRQIDLSGEEQIDIIVETAHEFLDRSRDLDDSLRDRLQRDPNLNLDTELRTLGLAKENLCVELVLRLVTKLGPVDAQKLQSHIEGMKRKMKIVRLAP